MTRSFHNEGKPARDTGSVIFAPTRTGMSRGVELGQADAGIAGRTAEKKSERFPVLGPYLVSVGLAIVALLALGIFTYYRDPTCANSVFAALNPWCHWPK